MSDTRNDYPIEKNVLGLIHSFILKRTLYMFVNDINDVKDLDWQTERL